MQHWNRWIRCVDPLFALDSKHLSSRGQRGVNQWMSRIRLRQNTVLLQLDFALMATDKAANECEPGILDALLWRGKHSRAVFVPMKGLWNSFWSHNSSCPAVAVTNNSFFSTSLGCVHVIQTLVVQTKHHFLQQSWFRAQAVFTFWFSL